MAKRFIVVRIYPDARGGGADPASLGETFDFESEELRPSEKIRKKHKGKKVFYIGSAAHVFKTRKAAEAAVKRTLEFAKDFNLMAWPQSCKELVVIPVEV